MLKDIKVTIKGKSPFLMHRYGGEEPSQQKAPRGKKTQDHIDAYRRKDWMRSAYFANGQFHIPPENVEAMLIRFGRQIRKGEDFKEGVGVVEAFLPLKINGRHLTGKLEDFYVPEYIDLRGVVIQKSRVDRCRPIFRDWELVFTIRHDTELVTENDIRTVLAVSSIGDFRPRFGRFQVTKFEDLGEAG